MRLVLIRRFVVIVALALVGAGCSGGGGESGNAPTASSPTAITADEALDGPSVESAEPATTPDDFRPEPRALGTFVPPVTLVPTSPEVADGDPPAGPGERKPGDLVVGDCLNLANWGESSNSEQSALMVTPCEDPHDAEAFARVSLNDDPDSPYPGDEHVVAAADRVCLERFEGYVGMRYVDARLEIVHLRPPRAAWIRSDRNVICMLVNANLEPLVGSLATDQ